MMLKIATSAFASMALFAASTPITSAQVSFDECRAAVPGFLDCLDSGADNCGALPVPDFAFPQDQFNDLGYALKHLRDTPNTHVFALGDFAVWTMIVVDVSEDDSTAVARTKPSGRKLLRGGRHLEDEEDLTLEGAPAEYSTEDVDNRVAGPSITIRLYDAPEAFFQFGEDGAVVGHHHLSAVDDILDVLNATLEDVTSIELAYSHGHFDHIGAANYTYNAIKALGFEDVPIVASKGTQHFLEELAESGLYSYRAPLPTVTFEGKQNQTVGTHTTMMVETVNGHMHDSRDVLIFFEEEEEHPAIMMMIDIVFPKWSPFYRFALTTDLLNYLKIHDKMLDDYDLGEDGYLIGGHLSQIGDRVDIEINKNMTESVIANARDALATTDFGGEAFSTGAFTPGEPTFGNTWYAFGKSFDTIIAKCVRATIEQFGCTLAAIDVMAESHCDVAQNFVRIDS
ncbi:Metallo-beta-lactamase superfamily [Seminavis robusta]|uniref:Metallo-beta-lactamase superfamily n=1 Tax=Seminavis robusta TaxID=568900 RepID=A0A9N8DHI2_9STRA|nr:Metallo-beta-lactamase superfamily [Seminavis robusta]|eukprot:Sro69_g038370.1 Metallo-beta-lactamase superfamily (455) ;mRNA; f:3355-4819